MNKRFTAVLLGILLVLPAAPLSAVSPSQSNPSVISGSQALLNGPYISSVTYPFFTSDHSSLNALLAGQGEIMDYPPDISDLQTAFATAYVNVTAEYGNSFENLDFNLYCTSGTAANINCPAGNFLGFRQAIAQVLNYSYLQATVLNGIQGIVSQNPLIPSAFGPYSTNSIYQYQTSLSGATASLNNDPQIAYNAAAHPTNGAAGSEFACTSSQTGVWQYATSLGSHTPNGTDFTPKFYTRPDHATWFLEAKQIWNSAAQVGLCLDLKQVVHFSGIKPIVYTDYSNQWDIYDAGASYSAPLNPVGTLYFSYSQPGIKLGPLLGNTVHFDNATVNALAAEMFNTGNATLAQVDSQKIVKILTYQIPSLNMWWDAWDIPSLNSHGSNYWTGYVDTPGFGTWSFATGYYTLLNVHKLDPATGAAVTGGNFVVNLHEPPDDYNIYQAGSVYDLDVINSIYYDTPIVAPPATPFLSNMKSWMLTSDPQVTLNVNMTTPHGYKMVDGQVIHLDFMKNITFADNVQFTANDYNFSMWYANLNGAYGPYVNNTSNFSGLLPSLLDTKVASTYSMDIYINSTSTTDYLYALTAPVVPEHLWSHVSTTSFNGDVDPTSPSNAVNGQLLETGVGAFYWGTSVTGQYVTLNRFPGYFRTNIHAWQLPQVQAGNAEPVSFAITQTGTPIPSSAVAKATATLGTSSHSVNLALTGGNWTGSFVTTGWTQGFYEVTVNATYTDTFGQAHTALQFYGLNVVSPPPPSLANLQVTVTTSSGTPISGASVTVGTQTLTTSSAGLATFQNLSPGTVTVTVSATGYQGASKSVTLTAGQTGTTTIALTTQTTTTTTTTTTDYTWYYVAAVVVIVVIIAGVVAYSRRGKAPQ
jgi:hypothetical protein